MTASHRRVAWITVCLFLAALLGVPGLFRLRECARQRHAVSLLQIHLGSYPNLSVEYGEEGKAIRAAEWVADQLYEFTGWETGRNIVGQFRPVSGLDIRRSTLASDDWQAILACRDIKKLYLMHTNVSDAQIATLSQLSSLETLLLDEAKVGTGCRNLRSLTRLKGLVVSETNISDDDLLAIGGLPALEYLGLSRTSLTDKCAPFFGHCPRLTTLPVNDTHVGDRVVAELTKCSALESLNLTRTQVTDAAAGDLLAITSLSELTVKFSRISDVGISRLAEKRNLRQLVVDASQVTPRSIAALKRQGTLRTLFVEGSNAEELEEKTTLLKRELNKTLVDSILISP
jgi:hypothetical protein